MKCSPHKKGDCLIIKKFDKLIINKYEHVEVDLRISKGNGVVGCYASKLYNVGLIAKIKIKI